MQIEEIPLSEIYCDNVFNVRGHIDRSTLLDFAHDIAVNGLQTPITIRPYDQKPGHKYQILAGHRRYTAFVMNNATTIPCIIRRDLMDEYEAMAFNIRENIQRENLTLYQEAKRIHLFLRGGHTVKSVAKMLGKTPGWVEPRRMLCELPEDVQADADKGVVQQSHIQTLWEHRNDPEKFNKVILAIRQQYLDGSRVLVVKEAMTLDSAKKIRKPTAAEISIVRQVMFESITMHQKDNYLPNVILSWVLGDLSLQQVLHHVKDEAEELGMTLVLPPEFLTIMET